MLFNLLPSSELIFAADPSPPSVTWEPQEQTVDGTGTGVLTAQLDVLPQEGTDDPSNPGGAGTETPVTAMVEVTLSDTSINGIYGELTFANGVASFSLGHGQSVIAVGLPAGVSYMVSEDVPDGFISSATGQTGLIVQDTVTEAAFVNTVTDSDTPDDLGTPDNSGTPDDPKDSAIKTGDESNMTLYALLMVFFAAGLITTLILGNKKKKKKE